MGCDAGTVRPRSEDADLFFFVALISHNYFELGPMREQKDGGTRRMVRWVPSSAKLIIQKVV
jgi:hypothetical protein